MIQANELRIGNYVSVYDDGKWTLTKVCGFCNASQTKKIDGFSSPFILFSFGSTVLRYGYDDTKNDFLVKPIPITPEILEKCGFEKDESGKYEDGEYVSNTKPVFRWTKGDYNEWYIIFQFDYGCEWTAAYHVRTLHQLQNLYFALTGEELECNLCK